MTDRSSKLRKLASIKSLTNFFFYSAREVDFFASVNWENLFKDRYPLYYKATKQLGLDLTYAFIDLYSWVMDFKDVFQTESKLEATAEFEMETLTLQHSQAWLIYNMINARYHGIVVENSDYFTLFQIYSHLSNTEKQALLPHLRSKQAADLFVVDFKDLDPAEQSQWRKEASGTRYTDLFVI